MRISFLTVFLFVFAVAVMGHRTTYPTLLTIFKKPTISGKNVGFLKIVGEIQQLAWKRSQKINYDVILHYISLPIYPLDFPKFCPIQKQQKTLKNCWYLVETTLAIYLAFYKLIFFESLIIFLESTIKLFIGIFDLQK